VLRQVGDHHEVVSNGVFLMDTRDGRSERLLVRAALEAGPDARSLLVGGLGVGFSLREAVTSDDLTRIDVVEIEPDLVAWHHAHLHHLTGDALADPRVHVVVADLQDHLRDNPDTYDVVCLDVDNGPDWTVTETNAAIYTADGITRSVAALRSGGVLAVWSAHASAVFQERLADQLEDVRALDVEVRVRRGAPDVVYVARKP
jgi:spermidine synthase